MKTDGDAMIDSPMRERTASFSNKITDTLISSFKTLTKTFSSPTLNTDGLSPRTSDQLGTPYPTPLGRYSRWTLLDALSFSPRKTSEKVKLPLHSFNHVAREVLSLEKSKQFYHEILGFDVSPRPPFDCNGYWLYGYGLSLHLVETSVPMERRQVKINRIKHFSSALPRVDHIAFVTEDIFYVKGILDKAQVRETAICPYNCTLRSHSFRHKCLAFPFLCHKPYREYRQGHSLALPAVERRPAK